MDRKYAAIKYAAFIGAVVFGLFGVTQAAGEQWNEETFITFRAPVEIQGMALPPGTYLFRLSSASYVRDIVEVYSPDRERLYGMFMTLPDYSLKPPDRTFLTFEERPAGSPQAIKVWFYWDNHFGREFVNPKALRRVP